MVTGRCNGVQVDGCREFEKKGRIRRSSPRNPPRHGVWPADYADANPRRRRFFAAVQRTTSMKVSISSCGATKRCIKLLIPHNAVQSVDGQLLGAVDCGDIFFTLGCAALPNLADSRHDVGHDKFFDHRVADGTDRHRPT